MNEVITIGIDIAKNVFQVHGINSVGEVIVRKTLRRAQMMQYFTKLAPVWWASRRAERATIGHARSRST